MKRDDVDLHVVAPQHLEIHERLGNWATYILGAATSSGCAPMFKHYRPYLVAREPSGRAAPDSLDAMKIEKAVAALPSKHGIAIRWAYVFPWRNAFKVRRELGVTDSDLRQLIHDARSMLRNRSIAQQSER